MRPMGFSTGALALDRFDLAMEMVRGKGFQAVELSALRECELPMLIAAIDSLQLEDFQYVSVHAPSRIERWSESELVRELVPVFERGFPVIVHPDVITDPSIWRVFGDLICVENMDKRKRLGRNVRELAQVFRNLPNASFCFDLGHARQIDPTMSQAVEMLYEFGHRVRQLHLSEVNASSNHEPLNLSTVRAFHRVAPLIPVHVPVILESPVDEMHLFLEACEAREALAV